MQSHEIIHNETVWPYMYSMCPSSHLTHGFLSCDLQSTCWAHFASTGISCESPLLPVPPMFVCFDQIEQVPYPLLCDHRPDCRDHSDEDFCVFPDCSGVSFQCGTKQVTTTSTVRTTTNTTAAAAAVVVVVVAAVWGTKFNSGSDHLQPSVSTGGG